MQSVSILHIFILFVTDIIVVRFNSGETLYILVELHYPFAEGWQSWLNAVASKAIVPFWVPGVRILSPPPENSEKRVRKIFLTLFFRFL